MNTTLYDYLTKPAIIAHRGSSAYAPENTIRAFSLALEQKADGIELDVCLTKDNHVVVIHDQNTHRTTGVDAYVSNLTLADVKKLDAGSHFDPIYHSERIPTLNEVFEVMRNRVLINIELKDYTSINGKLASKVAEIIKDYGTQNLVLFSSFNPISLLHIRKQLPETPTALLALRSRNGWLARTMLANIFRFQALHPHYSDVSLHLVARVHKNYGRIHPYTVDDPDVIKQLVSLGVDGIITNDPILARNTIEMK